MLLREKKYNEVYANTTWQKSDIRKWLNSEFYGEAFENVGAKFVLTSTLDNHKIQILQQLKRIRLMTRYFTIIWWDKKYLSGKYLKCEPTNYFKAVGGYVNKYGFVDWWSRTAGDAENHVLYVSSDGEIEMKGDYVTTDDFAIRPMIKVTYKWW